MIDIAIEKRPVPAFTWVDASTVYHVASNNGWITNMEGELARLINVPMEYDESGYVLDVIQDEEGRTTPGATKKTLYQHTDTLLLRLRRDKWVPVSSLSITFQE